MASSKKIIQFAYRANPNDPHDQDMIVQSDGTFSVATRGSMTGTRYRVLIEKTYADVWKSIYGNITGTVDPDAWSRATIISGGKDPIGRQLMATRIKEVAETAHRVQDYSVAQIASLLEEDDDDFVISVVDDPDGSVAKSIKDSAVDNVEKYARKPESGGKRSSEGTGNVWGSGFMGWAAKASGWASGDNASSNADAR